MTLSCKIKKGAGPMRESRGSSQTRKKISSSPEFQLTLFKVIITSTYFLFHRTYMVVNKNGRDLGLVHVLKKYGKKIVKVSKQDLK